MSKVTANVISNSKSKKRFFSLLIGCDWFKGSVPKGCQQQGTNYQVYESNQIKKKKKN